jgi:hypothetical protein
MELRRTAAAADDLEHIGDYLLEKTPSKRTLPFKGKESAWQLAKPALSGEAELKRKHMTARLKQIGQDGRDALKRAPTRFT